jgi:hypothetical protein
VSGNPVVMGEAGSSGFPTTPGAYDQSFDGGPNGDAFVAKLDASGTSLLWSTFLGGSDGDHPRALSLDAAGNSVVTGYTYSTDFPTTAEAYDQSHNGGADVFVARLNSSGTSLLWSTFLGGYFFDYCFALSLDPSGNPLVAGATFCSVFPTTPGAYDESYNGSFDVFVTKLDITGIPHVAIPFPR